MSRDLPHIGLMVSVKQMLTIPKWKIFIWTVPTIIILDQWTKFLAVKNFFYGLNYPVIPGFFDLTLRYNSGGAFSLLANYGELVRILLFILLPIFVLGAIMYTFSTIPNNQKKIPISLSLIVGGAIGNLIDRIRLEKVVDFILLDTIFPSKTSAKD